jgi:tetrahydromethanopterin S-methyltransferase subunit G
MEDVVMEKEIDPKEFKEMKIKLDELTERMNDMAWSQYRRMREVSKLAQFVRDIYCYLFGEEMDY